MRERYLAEALVDPPADCEASPARSKVTFHLFRTCEMRMLQGKALSQSLLITQERDINAAVYVIDQPLKRWRLWLFVQDQIFNVRGEGEESWQRSTNQIIYLGLATLMHSLTWVKQALRNRKEDHCFNSQLYMCAVSK